MKNITGWYRCSYDNQNKLVALFSDGNEEVYIYCDVSTNITAYSFCLNSIGYKLIEKYPYSVNTKIMNKAYLLSHQYRICNRNLIAPFVKFKIEQFLTT